MTQDQSSELMTVGSADASDPMLLSYAISSTPDPIQTSSATAASTAVITIGVSPLGTAPVYCDMLTFWLLIGADETALSAAKPTMGVNPPKWTLASSAIKSAAELGLPDDGGDQIATFTYTCVSPVDQQINYPLTFTMTVTPNTVPGIVTLNIEEDSGTSSGSLSPRDGAFPLAKVPFVFFLDNFFAANAASPAVPCTEFANGAASTIYFEWESNGTSYAIYEANSTAPLAPPIPPGQTFYTLPTGPSVDTTYILQATLTGPGDESDPEASSSQFLYQALTLTISNPDLTPKSVIAGSVDSTHNYSATLDVQNGWTRIGSFNTPSIPPSSEWGGMVVGWNRSGGAAETNLYNVFPGSPMSFVFSQIVRGGHTDLLTIAANGNVWVGGGLGVTGDAVVTGNVSAANIISGGVSANSLTVNGATINGQLAASGATIGGGLGAGSLTSGWTTLAGAPDYSAGCVSIGGTAYANVLLMLTNSQGTGYGMKIMAPNLGGTWWALDVHGQCINTSGSWSQLSDSRLTKNIRPFSDGLAQILKIDPVRYRYKASTGLGPDKEYVSVLADALQKTAPYMVGKARLKPDAKDEYLSIDNGPLIYMLINAVKELHSEMEELKGNRGRPRKG